MLSSSGGMVLFFWLLVIPPVWACRSLHSKSHGAELACCSSASPLPPSCEFSPLCQGSCSCQLFLSSNLSCSPTGNLFHEWKDHSSPIHELYCLRPSLPNSRIPFHLSILGWNESSTGPFLKGICGINVTKLVIQVDQIGELPDFGKCFPWLETVEISAKYRQPLDLGKIFAHNSRIYSIKTLGIDFELPITPPKWVNSIEFLHFEHSHLSELPKWLANAKNLTSLVIKHTKVSSIATVTQIKSLQSARLSHNRIEDAHRHAFSNKNLANLDLSHNLLSSLGTFTFSHCQNLHVLDLSSNPLTGLPFRPFLKNTRLKWLKLSDTSITTLTVDNFSGLSSLKTLTLSRSPLQSIAPFAFLPLKNLRSLDLQACNLTRIPVAVTQNCALTHLNLAENLLHRSSSLPPEVLALLSSLSQFRIEGNPLTVGLFCPKYRQIQEFPPSLFLLSTDNVRLYRQLVLTTTQLPLWTTEPCTPFYWHQHLRNKSQALRQLVAAWNPEKMLREGLTHCKEQYEWMADQITIYRDLERSSGCSVSRRLRSAMARASTQSCNISQVGSSLSPLIHPPAPIHSGPSILLLVSLTSNVVFLFIFMLFVCLLWSSGKRSKY